MDLVSTWAAHMMHILNEYSPLLQAVFTVLLVLVTWRYVRHTRTMVEAMQEEARPYVSARLAVGGHSNLLMGLEITNSGLRAAYNVDCQIDSMDALQTTAGSAAFFGDNMQRLLRGIACLSPGEKRFYPLTTFHSGLNVGSEVVIHIQYSRHQSEKRRYAETFRIRADEHIGMYPSPYMTDIDRLCAQLQKVVEELRTLRPEEYRLRHIRPPYVPRTKPCPFCKQLVPLGASVCAQCQRDLPEGWDAQDSDEEHRDAD